MSGNEADDVQVTERMKSCFAAMYRLKGNNEEKRAWSKNHEAEFRRELITSRMKITETHFDALVDWYRSKVKPRRDVGVSNADGLASDSSDGDGDGEEDIQVATSQMNAARKAEKARFEQKHRNMLTCFKKVAADRRRLEVETNTVQGRATDTKQSKRKGPETLEIRYEQFVNSDQDRSHDEGQFASITFTERSANTIMNPSATSGELPTALLQLKRELEDITADLRFRRASKEVAVELYDQTALKLADIMDRFNVAG
ncbi:hypothetical protein V5O48_002452 [Marasmius crinis-equi]|uniref:Uncharacterized protein n=1 Tax=Marasmius crinis-equi TaxID=585013 RepID=A0ABR3FWE9_9AGAR